jgi:hypothetical protein
VNPNPKLYVLCAWFAFLTISLAFIMGFVGDFGKRKLPHGLHSPVLAMELIRYDGEDVSKILGSAGDPGDDRRQMIRQIDLDWLFVVFYTILFSFLGMLLYQRGNHRLGIIVGLLVILAAVFDILENLAILGLLSSSGDLDVPATFLDMASHGAAPRVWSLAKWAIIFLLLILTTRIYLDKNVPVFRRSIGFITGGLALIASILGLSGIFSHTDALIEMGAKFMAFSLLVGFAFFATHSWLAHGLLPALDRLANRKWLRQLTTWPSDEEDPAD